MNKINELLRKSFDTVKNDGVKEFLVKAKNYTIYNLKIKKTKQTMKDILFVNGCSINYCERYRVHHKMEELMAFGITSDEITPGQLDDSLIKYYRGIVLYRYPYDEKIDNFIKKAKENNKTVFFDIDDLIFDLKFTKDIKNLKEMTKEERELYDDGIVRYGKTLSLCDFGITTTKTLAEEMKKHVKDVCIDKNIASLTMIKYSNLAIKEVEKDNTKIIIGYSSGSATHDADFLLVAPALLKILKKYDNVFIKLIGALEVPDILKDYSDRILLAPFVEYTKLPFELREFDINIAPLEKSIFNSAKSCIKWMEAAFVGVPTVASGVGDFHDSIEDMETGLLVKDDEWFEKLEILVKDKQLREKIARNARNEVMNHYQAINSGKVIADFVKSKLKKNICFVFPSTEISGGTLLAAKHAAILKEKGYDVSIINIGTNTRKIEEMTDGEQYVNVISVSDSDLVDTNISETVATMWLTLSWTFDCKKVKDRRYLVQSKESLFYEPDSVEILKANSTYAQDDNVKYVTISKWCQDFLKTNFSKESLYAPNGIDLNKFPYKKREFNGKIRILIEGDPGVYYKNVDEAFKITNQLDRDKYEVGFVSYNKEPKEWYKYDRFYSKVENDEMYRIYQEADILLKSSKLESFSYPPLEMMATGGFVVVAPNEGNVEYLKDGENCLFYEPGNIEDGVAKIKKIVADEKLREKLSKGAKKTVAERDWGKVEERILKLYE